MWVNLSESRSEPNLMEQSTAQALAGLQARGGCDVLTVCAHADTDIELGGGERSRSVADGFIS